MSTNANVIEGTEQGGRVGRTYLTFCLFPHVFAIDSQEVYGVIADRPLLAVPPADVDTSVRGALVLGKRPVAVMDLRAQLGLPRHEPSPDLGRRCIVIVSVPNGDDRLCVGLIVDAVGDVITTADADLEPLSERGQFENDRYIRGVASATAGGHVVLSLPHVLGVCRDASPATGAIEQLSMCPNVGWMRLMPAA